MRKPARYIGSNTEFDELLLNQYFMDWTQFLMTHKARQVNPFT